MMLRIGHGYDIHRLVKDRRLILGGVNIPAPYGLLGHSDADVLSHAICDALFGAVNEPDIGTHFPDNNAAYKDINSLKLLQQAWDIVIDKGFELINLDCTIIAEKPRLAPFIMQIKHNLATELQADSSQIGVKATSNEGLGEIGKGKAIAAHAVVLLLRKSFL